FRFLQRDLVEARELRVPFLVEGVDVAAVAFGQIFVEDSLRDGRRFVFLPVITRPPTAGETAFFTERYQRLVARVDPLRIKRGDRLRHLRANVAPVIVID